jgi:hypothetical protein
MKYRQCEFRCTLVEDIQFSELSQQRVGSKVSHGHLMIIGRLPCTQPGDRQHHCEVRCKSSMETAIEPAEESTNNSFTASNRFSHSRSTTPMF